MIKAVLALLGCLLNVLVLNTCALAEETSKEEPKRIEDNSFLIEEAYNQERGVVQHIQTFEYLRKANTWLYTFTQEWPVPNETNQLSYTIPVSHFGEPSETGLRQGGHHGFQPGGERGLARLGELQPSDRGRLEFF